MTTRRPTGRKAPSAAALRKRKEAGEDIEGIRAGVRVGHGSTAVLVGADDPSEWDDEELLHGRRRDRNGRFQGSDPDVVPKAVHDELIRRMMRKAQHKLNGMNENALEQLELLMTGTDVDDAVKLKAIEIVLNRTIGKVQDRVEVTATVQPWEQLVVGAIVDVPLDDAIETTGEEA